MKHLHLLATIALLCAPSLKAQVVTTLADSGAGSLREAIAITPAGGTVTFDPSLSGQTITLAGTQLLVDKKLTINASSLIAGITIDAAGNSRVFEINSGSTVTMHSLTLTGGNANGGSVPANIGGAIYINGSSGNPRLDLIACTLSGNSADFGGGIYINGFSGNAELSLIACTISGNSADFGGGIYSNGFSGHATLDLRACTLSGNSADFGGGIYNNGSFLGDATLSLTACTLSANSADFGGGIFSDGSFSGSATLSLHDTILAGNTAPSGSDLQEFGTPTEANTTLRGVNLFSDISGNNGLAPAAALIVDPNPRLSPLGHYGGPVQTIHPLAGSAAIDPPTAATTSPLSADAREFARVVNGRVDIGAVETGPVILVNNVGDGAGTATTLRNAIAGATTPGTVIRFNPAPFNGEPDDDILNGLELAIGSGQILFIDASDIPGSVTIDSGGENRIFNIATEATLALHSLTLTGGNVSSAGGAIFSANATLNLTACTLSGNSADFGGGIYNDDFLGSATLSLTACTLSGNSADSGGGIYNDTRFLGNATLRLTNCTLSGNSAGDNGGGIFSDGNNDGNATLRLTDCTLFDNSAHNGGGIYSSGNSDGSATLSLTNCTLTGNSAGDHGGGIFSDGRFLGSATLSLTACTLSGNSADSGGGIFSDGSFSGSATLSLDNTILAGNTAHSEPDLREFGTPTEANTTLLGINLFSDTSGNNGLVPAAALIVTTNLKLTPLGDFGGPVQTLHPLAGSAAIDPPTAARTSSQRTDARGFARVVNNRVDIGAVEAFPISQLMLASVDGDNIPDVLEGPGNAYPHLSLSVDDSAVDVDGDGSPDGEEIANMTDLLDSNSLLKIFSIIPAAGFDPTTNPQFAITIGNTFPGLSYRLESSATLTGFTSLPRAPFTANGFSRQLHVTLEVGSDFVRAQRD